MKKRDVIIFVIILLIFTCFNLVLGDEFATGETGEHTEQSEAIDLNPNTPLTQQPEFFQNPNLEQAKPHLEALSESEWQQLDQQGLLNELPQDKLGEVLKIRNGLEDLTIKDLKEFEIKDNKLIIGDNFIDIASLKDGKEHTIAVTEEGVELDGNMLGNAKNIRYEDNILKADANGEIDKFIVNKEQDPDYAVKGKVTYMEDGDTTLVNAFNPE